MVSNKVYSLFHLKARMQGHVPFTSQSSASGAEGGTPRTLLWARKQTAPQIRLGVLDISVSIQSNRENMQTGWKWDPDPVLRTCTVRALVKKRDEQNSGNDGFRHRRKQETETEWCFLLIRRCLTGKLEKSQEQREML